ncbi:ATP-binding protein [Actinacidiphila yeochonensis]|uniref:ATP-binding protein n=1 Tax=Actinacidiphila yeochonensis TaxID=89050 RepID=UPI0007C69C7E|nr:ATP-binding protein [Actinacidiphila yeochonensis]
MNPRAQAGHPRFRREVVAVPEAVAELRHTADAYTRLWGFAELAGDVALCVSELLSNVGKHTGSPECVLTLQRQADGVRVTVSDSSPVLPRMREPDWDAEGGRGLLVLQGMAEVWGAVPTATGKDVWVEMRVAGARAVCGERVGLPLRLLDAALRFASGTARPEDVERRLRCTLEGHATGDHHAFVMELDGDAGALWAAWTRGCPPAALTVLRDCAAVGPVPEAAPCCEFADHPGAHTWQLTDPSYGPAPVRAV